MSKEKKEEEKHLDVSVCNCFVSTIRYYLRFGKDEFRELLLINLYQQNFVAQFKKILFF